MKGITDIHNHILFGVDDGSGSLEQSVSMIKEEISQGVSDIILTPHFHIGECMPPVKIIKDHFRMIEKAVKDEGLDIKLHLGNEVMACRDMAPMLDEGRLFTLAGSSYVLVEFYPTVTYEDMIGYLNDILQGGYIPIIAHCERYRALRKRFKVIDEERINHIIEMGAYLQVNALTVYETDPKFVDKLVDGDYLHLIATDAHSLGRRGIYWDKVVEHMTRFYTDEYVEQILIDNPRKIFENQYI